MKKCLNCGLEVNETVKICPYCQYDFETNSFENVPMDKIDKKMKLKNYVLSILAIIFTAAPLVYRFARGLERANQREQMMESIYGTIEDGNYTFEQVSSLAYEDAQAFKPIYDRFISDITPYQPTGHEMNFYIFHQNRLIGVHLDATIQYADCQIGIFYSCDYNSIKSKEYSFIQKSNLDGNVDLNQVTAFCNFTKLPKDQVVDMMINFMDNIGNRASYQEKVSIGSGELTVSYSGGGEIHVTYHINYSSDN